MSPAPPHVPGRVLGRYAMYEAFAAGGMATVHYGRLLGPSGFSRTVAIKRLHAHLAEDTELVSMFRDEARLAARVHHPNVIQTLDVESSEGELFVVLDYVHGDSLARLLQEAPRTGVPVTPSVVGAILFGGLEGLHAAHEARDAKGDPLDLVHRDVSPHNVLVGTDGIARVLDFGVAKARGRAHTTRGGQLKGKLAYMAPEQVRGKVTRRSDVFAASVVLWEALAGRRLFEGEDDGDIIDKILHAPIPSPRSHAPGVTPALEAIVMRGLERDPSLRFATAREMAIALEGAMTLATPIEVGAFVERAGGAKLAERATRVTVIERECGDALGGPQGVVPSAEPSWSAQPVMPLGVGTNPTAVIPGLARTSPPAPSELVPESLATGTATVAEKPARPRTRLMSAVSLASLVGVVAGLGIAFAVTTRIGSTGERTAGVQTETSSTVPSATVSSPAVAITPDSPPRSEASESLRAPPEGSNKKTVTPRAHARTGCSPPYTIDARGVRHYKPECL